jgi:hypothetical protein
MTDEVQQALLQQDVPSEPQISTPQPAKPQKSSKNIWIIVGIVVGVLCLCMVACAALFGTSMYKVYIEKAPVEGVLDTFMQNMVAKDVESAYALFAPRVQRQIPIDEVQEMIEGNNYVLFDGYQSLTVQNLNIGGSVNTNPDVPQGTLANVDGFIEYSGNFTGRFTATLEKVDGTWMIDRIDITVPPDKFQP